MTYTSSAILVAAIAVLYTAIRIIEQSPISPAPISLHSPMALPKDASLERADHLGISKLHGPESIAIARTGQLYVSCADGTIMRSSTSAVASGYRHPAQLRKPIFSSSMTDAIERYDASNKARPTGETDSSADLNFEVFARIGEPIAQCGELEFQPRCGRPLGITFAPMRLIMNGTEQRNAIAAEEQVLLVADAYFGLVAIAEDGRATILASHFKDREGQLHKITFLNDVAVARDGRIFLSHSSRRFPVNKVMHEVLEGSSTGSILQFDPKTSTARVVVDGLPFPNGIALAPREDALLVSLTTRAQILRISLRDFIKSENPSNVKVKKRQADGPTRIFTELPGLPDNIRLHQFSAFKEDDEDRTEATKTSIYLVGLSSPHAKPLSLYSLLATVSFLRALIGALFSGETLFKVLPQTGLVAIISEDGQLLHVLRSASGSTPYVSEARYFDGCLYLGSFRNQFLARKKLPSYLHPIVLERLKLME